MPNRIIKESICTSDTIDRLGWFDEVVFYRLIVNCDDYGRFDGRGAIIKNRLFPLKDSVTVKSVEISIHKLATVGLVYLYEVGGKPYLQLPTWENHQRIRNQKSKFPAPDGFYPLSIDGEEMSIAPVIQSNQNPNPNPQSEPRDGAFSEFWEKYPKKIGKEAARKAFSKVPKAALPLILPAIERQKESSQWQKENGQYIPNPATWLNQGRWEDEPEASGEKSTAPIEKKWAHAVQKEDLERMKKALEKIKNS